jgi:hypothetical protein
MSSSKKVTGSHLIGSPAVEGVRISYHCWRSFLPVLDVMADMDFRFIDTRHEQAAST